MAEVKKHWVCVHKDAVQHYLDRGYQVEAQSALDYMRSTPACANVEDAELARVFTDHCMMTIGADEKKKLDTPKQKYALRATETSWVANRMAILKYDILDENGGTTLAAQSDRDGLDQFFTGELYDSPRECVAANRPHLLREVEMLRSAAALIEDFLRRHEAL